MAVAKITTKGIADDSVTSAKLAAGAVTSSDIPNNEISFDKLSQVNLDIAPEVLEIQVAAPAAGQNTAWLWTWEQSTLPYARRTITNSPEVQVPLYKQGTYTVNNYAAYDLFGDMTQTHSLYLKWIDGAGTDNLISWATDASGNPISDSHPDINSGNATDVQRINISVPSTITPPTLTAPSVSYTVVNNGSGAYTFSGSAAGDNPNIGPFYRGGTYTFNITASGHPLYLTTDNGTNFSAGTYFGEYTDGVTGSRTDSGTLTITVPSDAPDTLYYQCGNHSAMRGAITIKDLAVETNNNGNYIVYFQHTQEGHKTPVELRPIPSLVNQMCLVYDATSGKFVPQDLATYVENTPSFENKIREVAGTAELVVEDGSAVVAKVNVYNDSTYLPLVGNNAGDQAFATDVNTLFIWDGSAWQTTKRTDASVQTLVDASVTALVDSAPATLDTLNELAAALGDDPNFATTVTNSIATKAPLADPVFTGQLTASGPLDANLVTQSTDATTGVKFIDPNGTGHLHYVGASDHFYTTSKLSLGTSANNTPLDVYHATNNTVAWLESGDAGVNITFKDNTTTNRPYIGARGDTFILGHVSGGDKVYVKTSGSVGIGIDTPLDKLHVHNPDKTVPATGTLSSNGIVSSGADGILELLSEDDDSTWAHALTFKRYRQDTGALIKGFGFATFTDTGNQNTNEFNRLSLHYGADAWPQNNAEIMTWKPSGNIGIGLTDPQRKLDVEGPANDFVTVGARSSMSVGDWSGIHFGYRENNDFYRKSAIVFERTDLTSNNAQGKVHILNGPQSGAANADLTDAKITIAENGNVGIGTVSPSAVLQVVGEMGYNRSTNVPTTGILHDTSSIGSRTPLAIRTGASTSVPWSIIEAGDTYDSAGPYGVLNIARLNHSDNATGYLQSGIMFELKNPAGSIREYAGITGVRYGNSYDGGLNFYYASTSGGERQLGAQLTPTGSLIIGDATTNLGTKLIIEDGTYDTASTGGHIGLKTNDNNSFHHMIRIDSGKAINYDAYGTVGWRTASTIHTNQPVTTFNDQINANNSISHWTDSGTKFYTHLCTLSTYQATGAIIINTNIPGHNQSGNANMFSFRVTGYWYNNSAGGAIDMVVGCYAGENNYYNTTLTGTYPNAWKGKTWFATNSNGKVCLILGDTSTTQQCEIAVTDFVQGFINANTSYARDWSAQVVTSYSVTQQSTIYPRNPGGTQIIDGTTRNKLYRSGTGTFTVSNTGVFTPIGTLSHFKIDIHVNVGVSDDEGGGSMNPYANGVIERSINGGAWTTADSTGISDQGGVSCHVEMSPPRVGTASNGDTYMWQQDRYRTKNHSSTFIDQPSLNMGDTLQYRLRCNLTNGNHIQFGEPVGYSSDDNYMAQPFGFIVQEFTPWS